MRRQYTFMHFLWDLFLGVITFGLWWCWLIAKALYNASHR